MEPQNGLYLYGRGRVYLLAGKQDQAMQDFNTAAELDDEDAQTYIKHVARHSNWRFKIGEYRFTLSLTMLIIWFA